MAIIIGYENNKLSTIIRTVLEGYTGPISSKQRKLQLKKLPTEIGKDLSMHRKRKVIIIGNKALLYANKVGM